jgi:hypothetical protein
MAVLCLLVKSKKCLVRAPSGAQSLVDRFSEFFIGEDAEAKPPASSVSYCFAPPPRRILGLRSAELTVLKANQSTNQD